jgi:hypothetical protein
MDDGMFHRLLDGERVSVDYLTLPSLRVAMAKGVSPAKPISRISTDILNAGNWTLHGDRVRPKLASTTED